MQLAYPAGLRPSDEDPRRASRVKSRVVRGLETDIACAGQSPDIGFDVVEIDVAIRGAPLLGDRTSVG